MKIFDMLGAPCTRILSFLHDRGEVRYSELAGLIQSRGTLSLNLKHLEEEGLIKRWIVTSKPIRAIYTLTKKGTKVAGKLAEVRKALAFVEKPKPRHRTSRSS